MRFDIYLPLAVSGLFGLLAPALGRRLRPATATRLLTAGGVTCAAAGLAALAALASTFVGQVTFVAALGSWSGRLIHLDDPVPTVIAEFATVALAAVGVAVPVTIWRRTRALVRVVRAGADLPAASGGLVVVDTPEPRAFALPALPGRPSRIVVSTGMLQVLRGDEHRVLLAHERAHVRHRHHWYRLVSVLAVAANPLLFRLPATVGHTTERWADEVAAEHVGDRALAARAIARAALATRRTATVPAAFHHGDVPVRVRSLLSVPQRGNPMISLVVVAALLACLVAAGKAQADTEDLFERARHSAELGWPVPVRPLNHAGPSRSDR
jgi:Zn-dependent protease with chaperone function